MGTQTLNPIYSQKVQVAMGGNITATTTGDTIDTQGLDAVTFVALVSTTTTAGTSGTITWDLVEGATASPSTTVSGSGTTAFTVDSNAGSTKKWLIVVNNLAARLRYMALRATIGGTVTTLKIAAVAVCGVTPGPLDFSSGASGNYQQIVTI